MKQQTCQHEGCCKSQNGACGGCHATPELTAQEKDFLGLLSQAPFLPIGRFLLKSSRSDHLESVALAPVYLTEQQNSIEIVRENAVALKQLAEYGVITLDYDIPLEGFDYTIFKESAAYKYFQDAVQEGKADPDFIFDTAELELGSLALTGIGQDALDLLASK
jgi:hypothetical protein